ncbi:MAG: S8 family peptidase [Candidatus Aenigmatarchaeota archaeon]
MKKVILFSIIAIVLLSSITLAMTDVRASNIKSNRVIARTNSLADRMLFRMQGCKIIHELEDATAMNCPEAIASRFEQDEVLYIMDLQADQQIGADKVWALGYDGSGVTVAVLDTGVDYDHQELSDSIVGGISFVSYTSSYSDDHGHGTHVSGIITANGVVASAEGVAPGAKVWMAKVCDSGGSCYTSDIAAAIDYVVDGPDGAPNTGDEPAKIMSISLGGGGTSRSNCDNDYLASKVNWAVSKGVTVVAAAGNTGRVVSSPGCASGAIAVGAVDKGDVRPSWSGSGSALDIVAPGVSIYSSLPGGAYASWSGTSMATPHVSATVALMRQVNPSLTDSQIKSILYSTAKDLGSAGWDRYYGWGRVDAYNAYLAVKPIEPECTIDSECDDGLYCNGAETCISGVCQSGASVGCSYLDNQCNVGICDEASDSCVAQPRPDGTSCNDGLFCNVGETCQAGACGGGEAYTCGVNDTCTIASCDESSDSCSSSPVADGTTCDDNLFCTVYDACTSGICGGEQINCNDGVGCTVDSCNEGTGSCDNTPDNSICDDEIYCNGVETCHATSDCQAGIPVNCNDNNFCTADSCVEGLKTCENVWEACGSTDGCCGPDCNSINDPDCATAVKCWSGDYQYLYRNSNQMKKFCKCAMGIYGYNSYSYSWGRETVYYYLDSGNNEEWDTNSRSSYLPVNKVVCADGEPYSTGEDYYYG